MKESILKIVRIEAGLGNAPNDYNNNDPEPANFMVKDALKFDPKSRNKFINETKNIVETQSRKEDRAVLRKVRTKS